MLKVLDRHVAWGFAVSVVVSFGFVLCLYMMVHFFAHLENLEAAEHAFATRGIGLLSGVLQYHALTMPFILVKVGPFAVLLAAMWTIQRMVRDHEIAAAQVAGVSLHRLMLPILIGGVLLSAGLWAIRQHLLPRLAMHNREYELLMRGKSEVSLDGPMVVNDSAGNRFSIQSYEPVSQVARGVQIRLADRVRVLDVAAMQFDRSTGRWATFDEGGKAAPLEVQTDLLPRDIEADRGMKFLSSSELEDLARKMPGQHDIELKLQTRFTYPFATVVLLLLGIPLVLKRERQSIYAAWGLCLLVSILYFGAESVLHGLAERDNVLSPVLAAWIPIAVFGIGGALTYQDL
jgi:lipopolysaccharide export system permease protein